MSESINENSTLKDLFRPLFDEKFGAIKTELSGISESTEKIQSVGEILLLHLVLEKYIDEYVILKHPDLELMNYTGNQFGKKISLIKKLGDLSTLTVDAIAAITNVRNGFAHRLSLKSIEKSDKDKLGAFLQRWVKGDKRFEVISLDTSPSRYIHVSTYFILLEILSISTMIRAKKKVDEDYLKWQKDALESFFAEKAEGEK